MVSSTCPTKEKIFDVMGKYYSTMPDVHGKFQIVILGEDLDSLISELMFIKFGEEPYKDSKFESVMINNKATTQSDTYWSPSS